MAWGTNKFTKKLLRPNAVNNNELADFISRVPDNEELVSELVIASPNKFIKECLNIFQKNYKELLSSDELAKKVTLKKKPLTDDGDII